VLNWVFLLLIVGAALTGAFTGTMKEVTGASISSAKGAVELAIGLVGQMALWLGFMEVLKQAGLLRSMARGLKPIMSRLFPEVPSTHPAMSAMIMNIAANMLGLGNAATPFGLKAMVELNRLNTRPGVATNAMALFLAINTSGVAVLPLGVVAVRATLGSENVAGIVLPSMLATACSTVVGIILAKSLERLGLFRIERYPLPEDSRPPASGPPESPSIQGLEEAQSLVSSERQTSRFRLLLAGMAILALLFALGQTLWQSPVEIAAFDLAKDILSDWMLPTLMMIILLVGFSREVKVYEAFISGAKEGFQICVTIIPYLVAILVAIGMFRASGAMDATVALLAPVTGLLGFPAEALPMALIRPLSGSGAFGVMTETMRAYGPDSFVGFVVSVMNGSTETTFYVLAVYFGSVQVRVARHTVWACLAADITGAIMAVLLSRVFF